jgi:hypothetical protein
LDVQNNNYELFGANRHLMPFENHFKILYSNHIMFLHIGILHFSRISAGKKIKKEKRKGERGGVLRLVR